MIVGLTTAPPAPQNMLLSAFAGCRLLLTGGFLLKFSAIDFDICISVLACCSSIL
jgi:hypothetical protein